MRVNIVIADDHSVVREGIKTILESSSKDFKVIAEAQDGREVLLFAESHDVHVFILDISMPKLNGLETSRRLLKLNPLFKIIILSMHDDRATVEKALEIGIQGFLVKDSAVDEVIQAIEVVLQGGNFLSPSIAKFKKIEFYGKRRDYSRTERFIELTHKEKEVLQLLAEGYSSKKIASELKIAFNTVNVHRNHIMQKLDIHKTADLVRYAIKEGIIQN